MYVTGQGVPKDGAQAAQWFRRAADQGHATAHIISACCSAAAAACRRITPRREVRLAADQGQANAQFNLGVIYQRNDGVAQDFSEAMKWFRLAAGQGYAPAQYNLGVMHAE
jgi:uncharacterized protein